MPSVPPVNREGAGLLHFQKGTAKRGWTLPNFGRGRSVQAQNLGNGNTMEVRAARTINGIECVAFITILSRVSIIYSDSQYNNDCMYVFVGLTL
jgi:hypothetical protein